jgi:hypothetical protein
MNVDDIEAFLRHIGLEPWKDGRSIKDGQRTEEQHVNMVIGSLKAQLDAALERNHELEYELAKLKRNVKCSGCGHSHENHDSSGCLVWVEADASRKCLCKKWSGTEKRIDEVAAVGSKEWAICGWCAGGQDDQEGTCPKCGGAGGKWIEKKAEA